MKRTLFSLLLSIGVGAPFLSAPLAAEGHLQQVAKIPFAFLVSGKRLPAGEYNFSKAMSSSAPVFSIRNMAGNPAVFLQMVPSDISKTDDQPRVTFACYGKECVLAAIDPANGLASYQLPKPAIEKNLTHKLGMASMISVRLGAR